MRSILKILLPRSVHFTGVQRASVELPTSGPGELSLPFDQSVFAAASPGRLQSPRQETDEGPTVLPGQLHPVRIDPEIWSGRSRNLHGCRVRLRGPADMQIG